jgi:hypothetical protein
MAKKLILNRSSANPTALNREKDVVPSSNRSSLVSETSEQLSFKILDETSKPFPKFNATGRSLLIKFNNSCEELNPTTYLKGCITSLRVSSG